MLDHCKTRDGHVSIPNGSVTLRSKVKIKMAAETCATWWFVPVVLAVLFAYFDVWYFMRFLVLYLRIKIRSRGKRRRSREALFAPYDLQGIVLLSDIDFMFHMNNSKYLREMDYGRLGMTFERGIYEAIKVNRGTASLAAHCIRYRRSLALFQRFVLRTRVVCWDEDGLYVEQRMIRKSDGFVSAINLAKIVVRGTTMPTVVKTWLGESLESPPFPPEVACWSESIAASSNGLLKERQSRTDR